MQSHVIFLTFTLIQPQVSPFSRLPLSHFVHPLNFAISTAIVARPSQSTKIRIKATFFRYPGDALVIVTKQQNRMTTYISINNIDGGFFGFTGGGKWEKVGETKVGMGYISERAGGHHRGYGGSGGRGGCGLGRPMRYRALVGLAAIFQ